MNIPSSPADRKAIYDALKEISNSMTRIEGERDYIKEAINNTCENYNLNRKTFRRMAKVYHKQNFNREKEEHEEFETMYETITNTTTMKDVA
jgi:regulator of replication initiation timing